MLKVAVFGLGRFGSTVAADLYRRGAEVFAVDRDPELVERVADEVSVAVGFDARDMTNLQAYDVGGMDVAVVAIGDDFESSVLIALNCKELGVPTVYAKALNSTQEAVLRRVGADHVVKPEEDMGRRLAEHLLDASVVDFVELPKGFSLRRVAVPEAWAGQTLSQLNLMADRRLSLVQIVREGPEEGEKVKIVLPHGTTRLEAGDLMDVIGPDGELDSLA